MTHIAYKHTVRSAIFGLNSCFPPQMFSVRMPRFPVMALVFALPAAAAVFVPTVRIGPNKDVEMQMIAAGQKQAEELARGRLQV